jgi:hypothetical protein
VVVVVIYVAIFWVFFISSSSVFLAFLVYIKKWPFGCTP